MLIEKYEDVASVLSQYGWTTEECARGLALKNRNGKVVAVIRGQPNKYYIEDTGQNILLTGGYKMAKSAEKVASQYFYASKNIKENPMRSFQDFLRRKEVEYGSRFDDSALSVKFIPYYESQERIKVNDYGDIISGTVGVTTGWRPSFILIRTVRSMGSSILLSDKTKILEVQDDGKYRKVYSNPTYRKKKHSLHVDWFAERDEAYISVTDFDKEIWGIDSRSEGLSIDDVYGLLEDIGIKWGDDYGLLKHLEEVGTINWDYEVI